jgi:hypothetical protein
MKFKITNTLREKDNAMRFLPAHCLIHPEVIEQARLTCAFLSIE